MDFCPPVLNILTINLIAFLPPIDYNTSTKDNGFLLPPIRTELSMKRIWEFFENMDEVVYAADMETYQLVYLNKRGRDILHIPDMKDISGKKCYEVLQGSSSPCAMCTNKELVPGQFKEWSYYNPIFHKHLRLKDTMVCADNRCYRFEISLDDSRTHQQSDLIHQYQNMEVLANRGFQLALDASDPVKGIQILLEFLGKALHGERAYIFERNKQGNDDNTYEWVANGVTAEIDNLQNLPADVCANWYRLFQTHRQVVISDLEDIRESDPLQYGNLKRQNIRSLVVVPLYDNKKIIGFFGIDNPPAELVEYASNMLQITASFFIAAIRRRNMMRQLLLTSRHDQLTGFGNRYAVEDYIRRLDSKKDLGVLFCDITGLKQTNDTQGHMAGDRLILCACECLRALFPPEELFRIGGDELLVLCAGISRATLKDRVIQLRGIMKQQEVNMAIGVVWKPAGEQNLDAILTEAEQLMYIDKAEYYEKNGIERRR